MRPEAIDFIKTKVIEDILSRVFKFVQEKQALDKQRKTWNLQRSQNKVAEARARRTMWKFTTQKDTLRSRLGAVFDEFGDEMEHDEG